jgi:hypothetical protein
MTAGFYDAGYSRTLAWGAPPAGRGWDVIVIGVLSGLAARDGPMSCCQAIGRDLFSLPLGACQLAGICAGACWWRVPALLAVSAGGLEFRPGLVLVFGGAA